MRTAVFLAQVTLRWDPEAQADVGRADPAQQLADGIAYLGACWFSSGVTVDGQISARRLDAADSATAAAADDDATAMLELRLAVPTDPGGWRDGQEGTSRLWLPVLVNGVPHHLEALPVAVGPDDLQHLAEGDDSDLDHLAELACADGPFDTVVIGGHPHVLLLTPHT